MMAAGNPQKNERSGIIRLRAHTTRLIYSGV
jgi:hypothetical protein